MESFLKKSSSAEQSRAVLLRAPPVTTLGNVPTQLTFTCSNSTTETLEKNVKYVKS